MQELPDHIKDILLRKLHGEAAEADEKLIAYWVSQYPSGQEEIDQLLATWQQTDKWAEELTFDTNTAWAKVHERITVSQTHKNNTPGNIFNIRSVFKIAVAAAVIAGLIFGGWWLHNKQQQSFTTITATADQHLSLPEGTTVWLRKGASIRFPVAFNGKERRIRLSGEAFFDVKTIAEQPFLVETSKGLITVLGTSFLVNAGPKEERAAVITGKILFAAKDHPQKNCILSAHEEALFNGEAFERKTFTSSPLQWQQEELSFNSIPLKEMTQTLTIYYNTPVNIDSSKNPGVGEIVITASFENESLVQAIEEITKLTGLHYRQNQDSIIIY